MIDIEALLRPVSDAAPAGSDLRLDAGSDIFERIRQHRSVLQPEFDLGGEGKEADWPVVVRLAEEVLKGHSKDLEVIGWLTEALLMTDGFDGLLQGLTLMRRTLEAYWDTVHPGVDEGTISQDVRLRPISWLGGSGFLRSVKRCRLAPEAEVDTSWLAREWAKRIDAEWGLPERRDEMRESGHVDMAQWDAGFASLSPAGLDRLYARIGQSRAELDAIEEFLAMRCAWDSFDVASLRSLLDELLEFLAGRRDPR